MHAPSPLSVLADELGAVAGRVEREASLRISAALADFQRAESERELRLERLERQISDRVASLRDGTDGQDGASITVEDVTPLISEAVERAVAAIPKPREVEPEEIEAAVSAAVERAVSSLPLPQDGAPGEAGKDGAPGKLPTVRAWSDGVHYEGSVVTFAGGTYQALRDTGKEPSSDDWTCLAAPGRDATEPESRGLYNSEETYRRLNIVALDGGSFIARRDEPGPCPGDGWHLLVSRGKPGRPGERGERGERGGIGERGSSIISGHLNPKNLTIEIVREDGETFDVDLYPLAEQLRETLGHS